MGPALRDIDDHHANVLVANPADCAAGFDVGAGDCTAAEGLGGDRVRLGGFVRRAVRRGLVQRGGGLLAAASSTRRIFCCGVGWPSSGSPPKQAAVGVFRWGCSVDVTFQVRSRSRTFAWSGLSMEASVSRAAPVWSGGWLALLEVPLPLGGGAGRF